MGRYKPSRMFSGIVECRSRIEKIQWRDHVLEVHLIRPNTFTDIQVGDSIAVNGTCLTVEKFTPTSMMFVLGQETLKMTTWKNISDQLGKNPEIEVNVERSLKFSDRIHGHLVSGHVDVVSNVLKREQVGENVILHLQLPDEIQPYVWKKSSITINGVSLTVNDVDLNKFSVGLIPETLRRTQLGELTENSEVNLEADYFAKALLHNINLKKSLEVPS